ncbi:MAG: hypothetical protein ACRDSI_05565 [Pseudonocardiaceae bacterium]
MKVEPSTTDWITAVGTAGAFVAAVAAAAIAAVVVRHDRAARRAEQASRVAAWVEWREGVGKMPRDWLGGYGCVVLNTSPLPVYDVVVGYRHYDAAGRPWDLGTARLGLIPPGERVEPLPAADLIRGDAETGVPGFTWAELKTIRVLISFTDAAGRKWQRDQDGRLTERRPPRERRRSPRASVRPEELVTHVTQCRPVT